MKISPDETRKLLLFLLKGTGFIIGLFIILSGISLTLLRVNFYTLYFTFINNTKTPVNLSVDIPYGGILFPEKSIPPFSSQEIKISYEVFDFKASSNEGKNATIGYYESSGYSFFFKTRFLLEYDGEKINEIYARKIDCGIFCIFYDDSEIVPR